jgi:hypothetical protein
MLMDCLNSMMAVTSSLEHTKAKVYGTRPLCTCEIQVYFHFSELKRELQQVDFRAEQCNNMKCVARSGWPVVGWCRQLVCWTARMMIDVINSTCKYTVFHCYISIQWL